MNRRLVDNWNNKARASAMAAQKRQAHFERRDKEASLARRKPKFVAEVPVTVNFDDKVIGTAKIEQLPGGNCVAHIDASGMTPEMLRRGFSLGSFVEPETEHVSISLEKDPRT
jgi:hypothetical protein